MPATVNWYDEAQRIIWYRLIGNWTLEENTAAAAVSHKLSQQIIGRFDIIADLAESAYVPPFGALWEWKQTALVRSITFPNWGLTVIVTSSLVSNAFFEEGIQTSEIVQKHYRLAQNIEEALEIIYMDRANS